MHRISFIAELAQQVFFPLSRFMRERAGERETGMPVWLFLVAALYVSVCSGATAEEPVASEKPAPHIALLLPLKSATFGPAAEAVRLGFLAAAASQPQPLPVRVYGCFNEGKDIAALYKHAVADGARAVAGPLTRDGVAALAAQPDISVPTLALNVAEGGGADKLYFFGLSAEAEARQVAHLAAAENLHNARIINSGTPLSRRLAQAFSEEWKSMGRSLATEVLFNDDSAPLADLPAEDGNMIFLAANAEKARVIRPYLTAALPVYGTSQLFNGNTDKLVNFDLNDIRFVDMPWLLQPDHPAVMVYPRANPPMTPDMERLYALGIDAFRLLQIMLDDNYRASLPLDGVSGRIRLGNHHQFQREAIPALFQQGLGLTPEALAALLAAKAAENAAAAEAAKMPGNASAPTQTAP